MLCHRHHHFHYDDQHFPHYHHCYEIHHYVNMLLTLMIVHLLSRLERSQQILVNTNICMTEMICKLNRYYNCTDGWFVCCFHLFFLFVWRLVNSQVCVFVCLFICSSVMLNKICSTINFLYVGKYCLFLCFFSCLSWFYFCFCLSISNFSLHFRFSIIL